MYKVAQASIWSAEEIDLANDNFDILSKDEQHFIKHVLAFFASSDLIVGENLASRFLIDVQIPEARAFYTLQMYIETVHSETYSLLLDKYVKDTEEKNKLFNAITTIPSINKKADWALKYIESNTSFAERLVAFACVEGIFFSGSFCAIFWLKKQGKLPGLCFSNELISRDEGLHTQFACMLYKKLPSPLPTSKKVLQIIQTACELECEFVKSALPVALLGMNVDLMQGYIRFVSDYLLVQLGQEKFYNAKNPFDWMELISVQGKTNFFERRVGEYSRHAVPITQEFMNDEDF